ncbi:MAG: M4 family metallopeptidase [Blautia sp.]|nr:M4 family metallopeptidase [Blautia sp.]
MTLKKRLSGLCLIFTLLVPTLTVLAETAGPDTAEETAAEAPDTAEEAPDTDAAETIFPEGQLSPEDISALNSGAEKIFSHDGRVTFIDGTCTDKPVTSAEEASAVIDSVRTMIGADEDTEFIPWHEVTDPLGNIYYIFQQMYGDTTVCGGAVKVITDADGNMIALSGSVESEMPDKATEEGITAEEAEQVVLETEYKQTGIRPEILAGYTDKVILPVVMDFDIENEDYSNRFVWAVYTGSLPGSGRESAELPYLAHYVSMSGEYLYNMPAILPGDEAGQAGFDSSYVFEFMVPAEYTGYVDMSDGSEKEITVTVMRDKRTGMYYLGNIERRILIGQNYDFLFNDGQVVLESSPDNREWDQVGLLSLYNYCRAYDYYSAIGLTSPDGDNTPILILNNYCDDHYNEINNACYIGKIHGMQCFAASKINDYSQCLDVITHEFTHCVTGSLMTYSSYTNDYGAINEALSDIQGKNSAIIAGDSEPTDWVMGNRSQTPVRNMAEPHQSNQPEFTWDLYYQAKVGTPTTLNDHGGVHTNSSLLNRVAYLLQTDGQMTPEEARIYWFMVDCVIVPQTDYLQLSELLPWVLKAAGMEKYTEVLAEAIDLTRLGADTMPESMEDDRAILTLTLPDTEAFDAENWALQFLSVRFDDLFAWASTLFTEVMNEDYSRLPESLQQVIIETKASSDAEGSGQSGESEDLFSVILSSAVDIITSLTDENSTEEPDAEPLSEEEAAMQSEEKAKEDHLLADAQTWLQKELFQFIFNSSASMGQDGNTIKMVVPSGHAIPILTHAVVSDLDTVPDQLVYALYLNGKWYDLKFGQDSGDFAYDQILTDLLEEFINRFKDFKGIEDVLNLLTLDVKGGEVLELSSTGLEQINIPEPTPKDEKEYAVIEPGPKSRPKVEEDTANADTTDADAADTKTGDADSTDDALADAA